MNLILLYKSDFIKGQPTKVRLTGRRHGHVLEIHKAQVNDTLSVGLLNGRMGFGTVTHLDAHALEMDISLQEDPPPKLPVTLALALPRPIMLKRILSTIATLGVGRLILFNSWRVEKSFWNSSALKSEELEAQLVLGLEQARDTVLPEVSFRRYFTPFVTKEVPQLIQNTIALVAHPNVKDVCPRHVKKPVTLFIGPEGGFIDSEVEALKAQGIKPVTLGERILRVETAVDVLLSRLF
ncbi:MAG: 16S rRNA (uracil(1498)-N(3))-methyltransferase [Candidatus Omnitrophica bacterium]|nr:16S rRNA (uracil(1498)-N(3))-methyltransferase [Candidatus Omnitrophota bacterium]